MFCRTRAPKHLFLRTVALGSPLGLMALLWACSLGSTSSVKIAKIGDRVEVGPLTYSVVDAEWKSSFGADVDAKYPQHSFLVIRLSVTNGGAAESAIPHMTLEDSKGKSYPEGTEGSALPEWLPALRFVKPAQTELGRVYFDVPPETYKLRVSSDAEPGQEKAALIEIPLHLEAEHGPSLPTLPVPTAPGKE